MRGLLAATACLSLLAAALSPTTGAWQPSASAAAVAGEREAPVYRVLRDGRITESSGLTRSTRGRKTLFTHNDSGDRARVFAVGPRGRTQAVLRIRGADAVDWEDISSGPDHTLWIGDIGDNRGNRHHVDVYRIREPERLRTGRVRSTRFSFSYPGGARDAEALLVHPVSGRIYIVSKSRRHGVVYRAPRRLSRTRINRLRRVARAPAQVTAGAFAPNGRRFALGTYSSARVYRRIGSPGRRVDLPSRRQGESLAVGGRRGRSILVGSEGASSRVYRVAMP